MSAGAAAPALAQDGGGDGDPGTATATATPTPTEGNSTAESGGNATGAGTENGSVGTAPRPQPTRPEPVMPSPGYWYGNDTGGGSSDWAAPGTDRDVTNPYGNGSSGGTAGAPAGGVNNSSMPNASGGGGGGLLGGMFSPTQWYQQIVWFFTKDIARGAASVVQELNAIKFGVPAPGTIGNFASWLNPTNGKWPTVMPIYEAFSALALGPVLAMGAYRTFAADPYERRDEFRKLAKSGGLIVLGLILVPAYLHGMDVLARALAPDGKEFFATPGNAAKLGIGLTLGAAALTVNAGIVLLSVAMLLVQDYLIYVAVMFYPLGVLALSSRLSTIQYIGAVPMTMIVFLGALKPIQAGILRFTFSLPLSFGEPAASLETLIITMAALLIAFIVAPIKGTLKAVPNAVVSIAGKVQAEGSNTVQNLQEDGKLPTGDEVRERVRDGGAAAWNRATPGGNGGDVSKAHHSDGAARRTTDDGVVLQPDGRSSVSPHQSITVENTQTNNTDVYHEILSGDEGRSNATPDGGSRRENRRARKQRDAGNSEE